MSLNTSTLSAADRRIAERTTWRWSGTLHDETGAPIPLAQLYTVALTITDAHTGTRLVDAVDIKNTGRATIAATSGAIELTLLPADNRLVGATRASETHRITIDFTWNGGLGRHWHLIEVTVVNHPDIA